MRISDWSSDVCSSDLTVTAWLSSAPHDVPLHQRSALAPGRSIAGPAIIIDALSTTVVEPGWSATVEQEGTLRLTNSPSPSRSEEHTSELQSLMRISYAVFCLKQKKNQYTYKN